MTVMDTEKRRSDMTAAFRPGKRVRHRSPKLAHWRGTVTPTSDEGRYVQGSLITKNGASVHIRWDEGGGMTGWYSIGGLEPIPNES